MRIVFLDYVLDLDRPGRSGLSDIVWDMSVLLREQGHEVHVVGPYPQSAAPEPGITVHRVRVPPAGYRWHGGYLWICQRMARIAAQLKPDIIHAPEYISVATLVTLYPNLGAQAVVTVPGNVFHRLSIPNGFVTTPLGAGILKWAAQQAARSGPTIVAISEEMKRWWIWTGSPPHKTPLIPLGASPRRFSFLANSRASLGIDEDLLHFLFVGRFSPEKGLMLLIDALVKHRVRFNDAVRVTLIGKGILEDEIKKQISTHGLGNVIHIVPWVHPQKLSRWYSSADALILPSYTEGFSRVICESMLCGTPVIGSRIAGTEDHVKDGLNGFLFPAGETESLAAIIGSILDNPSVIRDLRKSTLNYAQETLAWPRLVDRIVAEAYVPIMRKLYPSFGTSVA